ncbi:hypothetical protein QQS21_000363 [Conoideocrella luteorostrata]|uniref:Disintegrin and metalloproteinase domain-containing protein B n=1 Tax=Conoideocrella luteorostrata TaxID=1105319 RepID=A0AAJ0D154_9HYPO|nr:hypothetical protein QQS21_000363 [Conoideocrella luteorostrata]
MKIQFTKLAFLGLFSLFFHNGNAESFRHENPREVVRLTEIEYSATPITHEGPENVLLSFTIGDKTRQRIVLELERNDDLFSQPVMVRHIGADGSLSSVSTIPAGSHLAFRGATSVRSHDNGHSSTTRQAGWARMTFFNKDKVQLGEGAFSVDGIEYHVQPDYKYRKMQSPGDPVVPMKSSTPYMVAWRDIVDELPGGEELKKRQINEATCSVSDLDFNSDQLYSSEQHGALLDRQAGGGLNSLDLGSVIGSTAGCPTSRQIALLGIATDCSYTSQFSSSDELREHVLSIVNTASRLYESSINVSLRIQNLTISDANCPNSGGSSSTPWNLACSNNVAISDRLSLFTSWRRSLGTDGNAIWSLLSACNSGSTVGIAWIGTVCNGASGRSQGTLGTNVVVRTRSEWQVLAHEIGHNFGAVHDCTENCNSGSSSERCCPYSQSSCDASGRYIMNPASTTGMSEFSPCTIGTICTAMGRNLVRSTCLSGNEDVTTISSGVCGNGIVEPGEECDCGGAEGCGSNRCCNPTTCRLVEGAACDASNNGCCTSQCQLSSSGSVCRASLGPCDPEEVCDGSSASCPADVRTPDGQSCGDGSNGTTCASGQCTSRSLQCGMALFNSTGLSSGASACGSSTCQMNCLASAQSSTCQVTGADFVDGTVCGNSGAAGLCYNGECRASRERGGGSPSASSWINRNRTVFIVIVVLGGLLVLLVVWCCISCVRRKRKSAREESNRARLATLQQQRCPVEGPVQGPVHGPAVVPPSNIPPLPLSHAIYAPSRGSPRVYSHRYA